METHDLHAWSWIDAYPLLLIDTGSGKGFNRGDLSPFVGTIAITLATRDADLSVESRSAEKPDGHVSPPPPRPRLSFFISVVPAAEEPVLAARNSNLPSLESSYQNVTVHPRPCCSTTSCISRNSCVLADPFFTPSPRPPNFSANFRPTFCSCVNK